MACDFVVAAARARWGMPEVDVGITPGWGGTTRLTRFVTRDGDAHAVYYVEFTEGHEHRRAAVMVAFIGVMIAIFLILATVAARLYPTLVK